MPLDQLSPTMESYLSNTAWENSMSYSTSSDYSPAMELYDQYNSQSACKNTPEPLSCTSPYPYYGASHYSATSSEYSSPPSPTLMPEIASPSLPELVRSIPRYSKNATKKSLSNPAAVSAKSRTSNIKTSISSDSAAPSTPKVPSSKSKDTEQLTEKQLKRRQQNRISQQAVRRRRNSPARLIEARLQKLDLQHSNLVASYASNIEACIQTLSSEIKTLRELQLMLQNGTSVDGLLPNGLEAVIGPSASKFLASSFGASNAWAEAVQASGGVADCGVGPETGVSDRETIGVDQSAAYQNHEFDSSVLGDHHQYHHLYYPPSQY